jgi:carboxymethylenebutenolidase
MQGFDKNKGVEDLEAAVTHLRGLSDCTGKVGSVGFCLGGLLAYLMVCRTSVDASVGYYGVNIQDHLDEAQKITAPLMLHRAGQDEFVPPEALEKVHEGLKSHPMVTMHDYPEDGHAFARPGGKNYNVTAARIADERTLAFFRAHLG